jgi:hypothetical protein
MISILDWFYYFSVWSDGLKKRHEMVFTRMSISLQQRAEVAPVEYETIKEEIKKKKIEAQRKSRITVCFHLPTCGTGSILQT